MITANAANQLDSRCTESGRCQVIADLLRIFSRAQDEPSSVKTRYRLAKAQMGQSNWEAAAKTVDQALLSLKGWV